MPLRGAKICVKQASKQASKHGKPSGLQASSGPAGEVGEWGSSAAEGAQSSGRLRTAAQDARTASKSRAPLPRRISPARSPFIHFTRIGAVVVVEACKHAAVLYDHFNYVLQTLLPVGCNTSTTES